MQWHEDPLGQFGPQAACRHCGRGLWCRAGAWVDYDGSGACAVAHLTHEPMPAGLRGAPPRP